jgi:hypothetical protein
MGLNTYSSRDFTRDVSAAKRAAERSPVIITDRGKPAYALLNIRDYYQLCGDPEATLLTCMDAITCVFARHQHRLRIAPRQTSTKCICA